MGLAKIAEHKKEYPAALAQLNEIRQIDRGQRALPLPSRTSSAKDGPRKRAARELAVATKLLNDQRTARHKELEGRRVGVRYWRGNRSRVFSTELSCDRHPPRMRGVCFQEEELRQRIQRRTLQREAMVESRQFPHHLIREIFEQPDALRRTIEPRVSLAEGWCASIRSISHAKNCARCGGLTSWLRGPVVTRV